MPVFPCRTGLRVLRLALAVLVLLPWAAPAAFGQSSPSGEADSAKTRHRVATEITIDEDGIRIGTDEEKFDQEDAGDSTGASYAHPRRRTFDWRDGDRWAVTSRGSDIVRFGEDVMIGEEEVVTGDVVAIGADVEVRGKVSGDVVAIGGNVTVEDYAVVNGEAVAVGGSVHQAEGSEIRGEVVSLDLGFPFHFGHGPWTGRIRHGPPAMSLLGRLLSMGFFLGFMIVLSCLFILIFGTQIQRIASAITRDVVKSGLVGLLTMVALPPALVLLCVTVIGIPAAAIVGLLWFLGSIFGMVAVSLAVGGRLSRSFSLGRSSYTMAMIGVLALFAALALGNVLNWVGVPNLLGWFVIFIGLLVLLLSSIVGIGGVVMSRFGSRGPRSVPTASTAGEAAAWQGGRPHDAGAASSEGGEHGPQQEQGDERDADRTD